MGEVSCWRMKKKVCRGERKRKELGNWVATWGGWATSCGGDDSGQTGDKGAGVWRAWWRKREERKFMVVVKIGREDDFLLTLNLIFSSLGSWNSPLFIMGGRGICCFLLCQILVLNSVEKDPNHWLKVGTRNYQIWQLWCQSARNDYTRV